MIQGVDDYGELKVADILKDDQALPTPRPITPTKACYVQVQKIKPVVCCINKSNDYLFCIIYVVG